MRYRSIAYIFGLLAVPALSPGGTFTVWPSNSNADLPPNSRPPFRHWDLREFPSCKIPYRINQDGTPDMVGEEAEIDKAFAQWEAVEPALIGFINKGPTTRRAISQDAENCIFWDNDLCSGDGWDAALKGGAIGVTYNFADVNSGVTSEADIVFDDQNFTWNAVPAGGQMNNTITSGDDFVSGGRIRAGANLICESRAICDDVQVVAFGGLAAGANSVVVDRGPNNVRDTLANFTGTLDVWCIAAHEIGHFCGLGENNAPGPGPSALNTWSSGVESLKNEPFNFPGPGTSTLTFTVNGIPVTATMGPGVLSALDVAGAINAAIALSPAVGQANATANGASGSVNIWGTSPGFVIVITGGTAAPILGIATGESGISTMNQNDPRGLRELDQRTVSRHDWDGVNFLYSPDLGDAPNVDSVHSHFFTSLVHGNVPSRVLSTLQLFQPFAGPFHQFSIRPKGNYSYELMASSAAGDFNTECEANIVNRDRFDDGVRFVPDPPRWGQPLKVYVDVQARPDERGKMHDYSLAPMWVNAWLDQNLNNAWEDSDHIIRNAALKTSGTRMGVAQLPYAPNATVWVRARLTWPEPVLPAFPALSPTLDRHEGATQFGEDEDYPLSFKPVYIHLVQVPFPFSVVYQWTRNGVPISSEPFYYDYSVNSAPSIRETVGGGGLSWATAHPEYIGSPTRLCIFPPREATDWRAQITLNPAILSDLVAFHLLFPFPGISEFAALELLPGVYWRIPILVPQFGTTTIYAADDLKQYLTLNPLGFGGGNWQPGQTLSGAGVTIVNGQAVGVAGMRFATSEFVYSPSSPFGYEPSGGNATLLNSASFGSPILILQEYTSQFPDVCSTCRGDMNGSARVDAADMPAFVAAELSATYTACADVNYDLRVDGRDISNMVAMMLSGGGAGTPCPGGPGGGGACCFENGQCLDGVTATGCSDAEGAFGGDGTTCAIAACPQPIGACCSGNSCFEALTPVQCAGITGTFYPDSLCQQTACPSEQGACCQGQLGCSTTNAVTCADLGGEYLGNGSACPGPGGCPERNGACCLPGGICRNGLTLTNCLQSGGAYLGDDTACTGNDCSGGG